MRTKWLSPFLFIAIPFAVVMCFSTPAMAGTVPKLVCDEWPPYHFKLAGKITGMSVEIVTETYRRMGYPDVQLELLPWRRAVDAIRFAEAEALLSANYTIERAKFLRYPEEPVFMSPWVAWTRVGSTIRTLDDLKGKTIGVVLGYSYTPEFWEFIDKYCIVEKVHSDEVNFKKLNLGRLDATIAEFGNGRTLIRKMNYSAIRPVHTIEVKRDGLFVVFNKTATSQEYVQRFSNTLKAFKQTEEYHLIKQKYLGSNN